MLHGSAAKHLQKSDVVVTQPGNNFGGIFGYVKSYFPELENQQF